ncbi:MAG: flagellar hook-associated protein FlgK, partial [Planctomycetota bacterium]
HPMSRIALNTGLRALLSSQFALDNVGQNIANANTVGYSRQRVDLAAGRPQISQGLIVGSGVDVLGVRRQVDNLLERRILSQGSITGRLDQELSTLSELEALFADLEGFGLGTSIDNFFSDVTQLSANPQDTILQTDLVQATLELTDRFNSLQAGSLDLANDIRGQAQTLAGDVNQLAVEIARLNDEISSIESGQIQANDLRDQRQVKLQELAELADIQTAEDQQGQVRVQIGGSILVNGTNAQTLEIDLDSDNRVRATISSSVGFVPIEGGQIGGLIGVRDAVIPGLNSQLDQLAREMILEVNRVHSTGLPSSGPLRSLLSTNTARDVDGDGRLDDELLRDAFPFEVQSGVLMLNTEDLETGEFRRFEIEVDASRTTISQFIDAINDIPQMTAELDAFGRIQLAAEAGVGFDFSGRLDPNPDPQGTLGGSQASVGSGLDAPFELVDGDVLEIGVPNPVGGSTVMQVEFDANDFADIGEATAEEVAAVFNSDPATGAAGLRAVASHGRVFFQTEGGGPTQSLEVVGGSAVGGLGLTDLVGVTVSGSLDAVDLELSGAYQGDQNSSLTFVPRSNGTVGTTPGLVVDVFDDEGQLVSSLDVGEGYEPGQQLDVIEGIQVSFGLGELSAEANDRAAVSLIADSDTTDVLVATGLNSLLTGVDAQSIGVRSDIVTDPSLLAGASTSAEGDNGKLLELIELQDRPLASLGGQTIGSRYANFVGDFGFEVSTTSSALGASNVLEDNLAQRRASVSGVNVDEELVSMVRYEQAYNAAAQFIDVVNQLQDELLAII